MDVTVKRHGDSIIIQSWGQDYQNDNGFSTLSLWLKPELALAVGHALIEEANKLPRVACAADLGIAA
jgi:hypothetical protein